MNQRIKYLVKVVIACKTRIGQIERDSRAHEVDEIDKVVAVEG